MTELEKIGKYEVLERIGEGGFAAVYKGRDPFIKRLVAIKICIAQDEALRRRFLREAEISGNLHHRNIVTVFDFGFAPSGPYLVQEYLPGEDLKQKIARRDPIPEGRKLGYLRQIALGLQHAHSQGVLHRDVKPGNVRVLDNDRVKILDFGIAKLATAVGTQLTEQGSILGTAGYLPPEQILGKPVDARADVFSFGALAYELLTYRRPFGGKTLTDLFRQVLHDEPPPIAESWPDCPPELAALIARCLAKAPEDRYPGFAEVILDLTPILARARTPAPTRETSVPATGEAAEVPAAAIAAAEAPGGREPGDDGPSEDTRPIPAAVVLEVLSSIDEEPLDPTSSLRARQEVESTMIGEAPPAAPDRGADDGAEPVESRPSLAAKATHALAGLSGGSRRAGRAIGAGWTRLGRALEAARSRRRQRPARRRAAPAIPRREERRRPIVGAGEPAPRGAARRWLAWTAVGAFAVLVAVSVGLWVVRNPGGGTTSSVEAQPPDPSSAAAAPASGTLVVDALPWGEVTRIVDANGSEIPLPVVRTTPARLSLPPGGYIVDVVHPGSPEPRVCRAEVTVGVPARCRVEFFRLTAADYFREAGWWR